jgi:hypothetical protein
LALDSPGLDWIENVAGFAPVKFAIAQWLAPQVFRSEFGMNVPPSLLDGMALIKQLAPLPPQPQPHGGGKRPKKGSSSDDASPTVAIAIPFSPSRVSGVFATLKMYRDFPPDADVDIVLVCSRDEKLTIEHWTLNIEQWTVNIEHWTLNIEHWTLNIEHWTLNIEHWTLNIEHW